MCGTLITTIREKGRVKVAKKADYFHAWFNQLKKEDQINQALLDLSRNESRLLIFYKRDVRLTPPLVSISNNTMTVERLNTLIKKTIHQIVNEQGYLDYLKTDVPDSDIQQVMLGEHIRSEKDTLRYWLVLLNALVFYTHDIQNPKKRNSDLYITSNE